MNHDYAILKLGPTLDLKTFEHKDDWKTAMATYASRDVRFIALKYHHGVSQWQQVEVA